MRPRLLALAVLLAACAPAPPPAAPAPAAVRPATEATDVERVVQAQVDAYNRRDVDAFLATYAPDMKLYAHPDRLLSSGQDAARAEYTRFFAANPRLNVAIANRMVQGSFVIDHEVVTGLADGSELRAVAVYEVKDGKIQNVWFIQ